MKTSKLFTSISLITIALSSCLNMNMTEPEQIGDHVFEILKSISTNGRKDYMDNFLSIREIRELGNNKEVVKKESTRNKMTSMPKDKWVDRITQDYNQIKEKGASSGMIWQEIEYLDFVYELEEKNGLKGMEGELYFKYDEEIFKIEISAIWNGKEYRIIEIEDLDKK